jgi:hypothetical protein
MTYEQLLSVATVSARRAEIVVSMSSPTTAATDALLLLDDIAWAAEYVASRASSLLAAIRQKG